MPSLSVYSVEYTVPVDIATTTIVTLGRTGLAKRRTRKDESDAKRYSQKLVDKTLEELTAN
ncbi:MAG: hypothetical protein HC780_10665 [Leptolyngbyaceae cyanobacterium CSU_1_3]|nr:hypothetical protein [Leptolyngbyaceae cyanobacterium CSU_1_3]